MAKHKIEKFRSDLASYKKIGLDSMIFIYQFSAHPLYAKLSEVAIELLQQGEVSAVTTSITLAEVFVQPEKKKNQSLILEYEKVFQNLPNLEIVSVDWHLARLAAKIRASYPYLRIPDALQLSAPLLMDYPAFLTNDYKLKKVDLLKVIILRDYL